MSLTTITITGSLENAAGEPATGSLTAQLTAPIKNGTQIVESSLITGELAAGKVKAVGGAPFTLVANDDTGTEPAGTKYTFVLTITGGPSQAWVANVPHTAAGGTIDITALGAPSGTG